MGDGGGGHPCNKVYSQNVTIEPECEVPNSSRYIMLSESVRCSGSGDEVVRPSTAAIPKDAAKKQRGQQRGRKTPKAAPRGPHDAPHFGNNGGGTLMLVTVQRDSSKRDPCCHFA